MRSISSFMVQAAEGFFVQRKERTGRFSARASEKADFGELFLAPAGGDQPLHDADCFFPGGELLYEVFFRVASQKNDAAKFPGFCGEISEVPHQGRP